MWSLVLFVRLQLHGFCRTRACRILTAFMLTHSKLEQSAKACSKRASSWTKELATGRVRRDREEVLSPMDNFIVNDCEHFRTTEVTPDEVWIISCSI